MTSQLAFIKTIQPYFVMGTSRFEQYVFNKYRISHFYSYETDKMGIDGAAVPDGCVDIIFIYGAGKLEAKVCGTVLKHKLISNQFQKTYFGVRFFPGVFPHILKGELKEFVDQEFQLSDVLKTSLLLEKMSEASTFAKRIHTFLEEYKKTFLVEELSCNRQQLFKAMQSIIYQTNGEIRVKEIEERTGYSARYINKIFNSIVGINPKTFSLIIKFQCLLANLHSGNSEDMVNLAANYGYYDQAYLIKEFTKFTNMTPKRYYQMIQEFGYHERVTNFCHDDI